MRLAALAINIMASCLSGRFAASTIPHTKFARKPIGRWAGRATVAAFSGRSEIDSSRRVRPKSYRVEKPWCRNHSPRHRRIRSTAHSGTAVDDIAGCNDQVLETYHQRREAADALVHWCSALDSKYRQSAAPCYNVTCSGQPLSYGLAGQGDSAPSFLVRFSSSESLKS